LLAPDSLVVVVSLFTICVMAFLIYIVSFAVLNASWSSGWDSMSSTGLPRGNISNNLCTNWTGQIC